MSYQSMALNQITYNVISVILLLTLCFASRLEAIGFGPKVTVEIINDLDAPPTQINLTLHCKSKNDDVGFHTLNIGERYQFGFRASAVGFVSTLYFCSFTWPGQQSLHYIDIYDQARDSCHLCSWKIWKNGGCTYNEDSGLYNVCYPWNKGASKDIEPGVRN